MRTASNSGGSDPVGVRAPRKHARNAAASGAPCHVCGADKLVLFPEFSDFRRVASDCRPWAAGGQLAVCRACGIVQKVVDEAWQREADEIYATYALYHQSADGSEQRVFDQSSGTATPRSQSLFQRVFASVMLPEEGRILDVGCGIGVTLSAFSQYAPAWKLHGVDPNLKDRAGIEAMPNVEAVYDCQLSEVPGSYDLITIVHVFEHVVDPGRLLVAIRERLGDRGLLMIQVPHFPDNPFDLLVADHCTHFTPETMKALLNQAGFEIVLMNTDIVPKEMTVLARPGKPQPQAVTGALVDRNLQNARESLGWLGETRAEARRLAAAGHFGLFGTSIAANWLVGEVGDPIRFFIEEDPSRIGTCYRNRPVHHPKDAPADGNVFLCLAPRLARDIRNRMPRTGAVYHLPPDRSG